MFTLGGGGFLYDGVLAIACIPYVGGFFIIIG